MRARTPILNAKKKAIMGWQKSNEERMLDSLNAGKRKGGMTIRIRFELQDPDGKYRGLAGKTVVVRKIPTQGKLLAIVDGLIKGAVEEAMK